MKVLRADCLIWQGIRSRKEIAIRKISRTRFTFQVRLPIRKIGLRKIILI